jgi:hypothetical protein
VFESLSFNVAVFALGRRGKRLSDDRMIREKRQATPVAVDGLPNISGIHLILTFTSTARKSLFRSFDQNFILFPFSFSPSLFLLSRPAFHAFHRQQHCTCILSRHEYTYTHELYKINTTESEKERKRWAGPQFSQTVWLLPLVSHRLVINSQAEECVHMRSPFFSACFSQPIPG